MGYTPHKLSYLVSKTIILTNPDPIPFDSLLSTHEYNRRGLSTQRIYELCCKNMMIAVGDPSVANIKLVVGITPELQAAEQKELDEMADGYERRFHTVKDKPSELAKEFLWAMEEWNALLQLHNAANHTHPQGGNPRYPWYAVVLFGFNMDHLRAKFDVIETHIGNLIKPLSDAVVPLQGMTARNLMRFVDSISIYSQPPAYKNPHYVEAHLDTRMLIGKLAEHEAAEEKKKAAEAGKKGLKGVRQQLNETFVKEGISSFVKSVYAGVGALLMLLAVFLWHWFKSKP
jgi:hypothetical protein